MESSYRVRKNCRGVIKYNEPLAQYISWRVGGKADLLYRPADLDDLKQFLFQLSDDEPITWLGLGSNTLVRDKGIRGVVIVTQGALDNIALLANQQIYVEAGAACAKVARFAARQGYHGAEFLAGIPGTMGGALRMNAGAFGGETWQLVKEIQMINRHGEVYHYLAEAFKVGYRQVEIPAEEWFISATLQCQRGQSELAKKNIRDCLDRRKATQPTSKPSCGSVFRNPPNDYAARLIEVCGLKGYRLGGAQVSDKHANFILNVDKASAEDIENLMIHVHQTVLAMTGVNLHHEVKIIGEK